MPRGGNKFDQFIVGDNEINVLNGEGEADHIRGMASRDYIYGYEGNDLINGGRGDDEIYGGDDDDVLNGNAGDDKVVGGNGDDIVNGGRGADELWGDFGYSFSGSGNDILTGGPGNDLLGGGGGDDIFVHSGINEGGDGFDEIYDGDFDVAEYEGSWEVHDLIQIDETNFAFYDGEPIAAGDLDEYLYIDEGDVLYSDLDGSGGSGGTPIIDTNVSGGEGVAVSINDQTFVWSEGDGVEVV